MGLLILLLSLVFTWGQDSQMQKTNFSPTKNSQGDSLVDVKTLIDFKALDLLQSINSENSPLDSLAINKNSVSGISAEVKPQGKNIQYLLLLLDPISGESYANQKILLESKYLGITGADGTLELSLPYQENFQFFLGTDTLELLESNFKTPTKQNFVQFILQAQKKAPSVKTQVDVVVVAERQALHQRKVISKKVLKRQEMQEVATTQGDPLRTVYTLPGVSAQNDASVRPYVRDGDEKETRVFWNNIPIIKPYHAFSLYSVYNMEGIEKVAF